MSPRVDGNTRTERFMRKWYPGTFCVALNPHVSKTSQKWSDFLLVLFLDTCFSCVLLAPIYKRGREEGRRQLPLGSPSVQDRKLGALLMSDKLSLSFYSKRESWWVFQACLELTELSFSPSQSWDYKPADLTLYSKKWWRGGWNFPLRVEKQNPWGNEWPRNGQFLPVL